MTRTKAFVASIPLFFALGCTTAAKRADSPLPDAKSCADCPLGDHFEIDLHDGLAPELFVRGMVNGQPRKFRLDLGSAQTALMSDAQTESLPSLGKSKSIGLAAVVKECDNVRIANLTVAHLPWKNVAVERCSGGILGINNLGVDLFDREIFTLDFSSQRLYALTKTPPGVVMQPLQRIASRHILIPIILADESVTALFDTGAMVSLVDQDFMRTHKSAFQPFTLDPKSQQAISVQISDMAGEKVPIDLYQTTFKIAGEEMKNQLVAVAPFPEKLKRLSGSTPIIFGANAMAAKNWIFDLKNNMWAVQPAPPKDKGFHSNVSAALMKINGDTIRLEGHVVMKQPPLTLSADVITVNLSQHMIEAADHCVFNDGKEDFEDDKINIRYSETNWEILPR